jgi:hypothetical protein
MTRKILSASHLPVRWPGAGPGVAPKPELVHNTHHRIEGEQDGH